MRNQPYFPKREGDQLTWFTNLQTKITKYFDALDIGAARQAKITLCLSWLIWAWQAYLPARRQDATTATTWRDNLATGDSDSAISALLPVPAALTPPAGAPFFGMLSWLFEEIGRWKKAEGYSEPIGEDLGLTGPEAQPHTDPPALREGDVAQNHIELLFTLWEHDGVWIESQRQGDAGFTFLATDTASPYNDTRPVKTPGQAEWRDYRACWWDADTASMVFGPVLRVLVAG